MGDTLVTVVPFSLKSASATLYSHSTRIPVDHYYRLHRDTSQVEYVPREITRDICGVSKTWLYKSFVKHAQRALPEINMSFLLLTKRIQTKSLSVNEPMVY